MILKHLKTNKPAGEKEKAYIKAIFEGRTDGTTTKKPMVKLDNIIAEAMLEEKLKRKNGNI